MNNIWRWIFGIAVGLALLGFVVAGRSDRQAYRAARGLVEKRVILQQDRIFYAAQLATKAVDLALLRSGDLPANYARAAEIKDKIQEIAYALILITDARGDIAVEKLDKAIELFNSTLETIDEASKEAESPAVKTTLDRVYGILDGAKELLVQVILTVQQ